MEEIWETLNNLQKKTTGDQGKLEKIKMKYNKQSFENIEKKPYSSQGLQRSCCHHKSEVSIIKDIDKRTSIARDRSGGIIL